MRDFLMRGSLAAVAIGLGLAMPALAQTDLSAEIGRDGISAVEARLSALPDPSDADRFALGGLRFLRGIEGALQARWQAGVTEQLRMLPVLRLPIPENPNPGPFDPAALADGLRNLIAAMDSAQAPLEAVTGGAEFGVTVRLADIWFDINGNAGRDTGEGLVEVAGAMIPGIGGEGGATGLPDIRFDAADAAWLAAYAHLLAGLGETVLAYDPTDALEQAGASRRQFAGLAGPQPPDPDGMASFGLAADAILVALRALDQAPDAERLASAQAHLLAMVAQNRIFWKRVALESDNMAEWLPNDRQTSALGLALPPETGRVWMGVLGEVEAVLKGELLMPHWRLSPGAGVNVARMFTEPAAIDIAGWANGADALPYAAQGPVMTGDAWRAFVGLMGGEAMMMTVILN